MAGNFPGLFQRVLRHATRTSPILLAEDSHYLISVLLLVARQIRQGFVRVYFLL